MTEQTYKSLYTPRTGDFGKFIVYQNKEGNIVLAANNASVETTGIKLDRMEQRMSRTIIGTFVGMHREIAESLRDLSGVLGGALFTVPQENRINIFGNSGDYGPINDELVKKCLGDNIQVTRLWR